MQLKLTKTALDSRIEPCAVMYIPTFVISEFVTLLEPFYKSTVSQLTLQRSLNRVM